MKYSNFALSAFLCLLIGCRHGKRQDQVKVAPNYAENVFAGESIDDIALPNELFMQESVHILAEPLIDQDRIIDAEFDPIYFEFGLDVIKPGQKALIEKDIKEAKKAIDKGHGIVVEGHACNSAGTETFNMQLSEKRAHVVRDELLRAGLSQDSIRVVGRGTSCRIVLEGDRHEQAPNRRVEIHKVLVK